MEPDEQTLREWWDGIRSATDVFGPVYMVEWDELWPSAQEQIKELFKSVLVAQAKTIPDVSV